MSQPGLVRAVSDEKKASVSASLLQRVPSLGRPTTLKRTGSSGSTGSSGGPAIVAAAKPGSGSAPADRTRDVLVELDDRTSPLLKANVIGGKAIHLAEMTQLALENKASPIRVPKAAACTTYAYDQHIEVSGWPLQPIRSILRAYSLVRSCSVLQSLKLHDFIEKLLNPPAVSRQASEEDEVVSTVRPCLSSVLC